MAMHRVAPDIPLWVGSIYSLSAHISFEKYNINHIISMVRGELPANQIAGYTHLHVEMDDDEEENIMQYFPETNKFIEEACGEWMTKLAESGKYKNYPEIDNSAHLEYPHNPDPPGVLVHCMAGISRSSTVVIAYLMKKLGLTAEQGMALVKSGRKIANPNPSFVEQLKIYEQCGYEINDSKPLYRQWILKKDSEGIPNIGSTPKFKYRSETEGLTSRGQGFSADFRRQIRPKMNQSGAVEEAPEAVEEAAPQKKTSMLRCRMCRQILASSNAFIVHEPKTPMPKQQSSRNGIGANASIAPQCMQYYVEPIEWMRDELEKGALDGKLNCPKCKAKLGSYKWQGSKCSCGKWCTPAIELTRSKVDEMMS